MERTLTSWTDRLVDLVFPKNCLFCGRSFRSGLSNILCDDCFDSISIYEPPTCDHCGVSVLFEAFEDSCSRRCRDCGEKEYFLDRVVALGPYEGPLRIAHHAFKFEGMENLGKVLVDAWCKVVPNTFFEKADALVSVPLSPEKYREKGYNPAEILAKELSHKTRIPQISMIHKVRPTRPQMSLSRAERSRNVQNAFALKENIPDFKRIILVDDVFTTGATLEECAKVLKKAGIPKVDGIICGRTPHTVS